MELGWIEAGLASALALAFVAAGGAKLAGADQVVDELHHVGVNDAGVKTIGALEVSAAAGLVIGLWVPGLAIAAAIGLVALTIGAVTAHVRAGDGASDWAGAAALGTLALVVAITIAA